MTKLRLLTPLLLLLCAVSTRAAGGACPTGTLYLNPITNVLTTLAAQGITSCYYLASNGADTNTGVDEAHPWVHMYGMINATSNATHKPVAGEGFILRGNDQWHRNNSAATVYMGNGTWNIDSVTATSANPVYIGVDFTWFSGTSWGRPVINLDNPTSTSFITSCTYDMGQQRTFYLTNDAYIWTDNLEWTGLCHNMTADAQAPGFVKCQYTASFGVSHDRYTNNYFHGWTLRNFVGSSTSFINDSPIADGGEYFVANVFDGADSHCTGLHDCTGWPLQGTVADGHYNVLRFVSNGFNPGNGNIGGVTMLYQNRFDNVYQGFDGQAHSGVYEPVSQDSSKVYMFNLLYTNSIPGLGLEPEGANSNFYLFNSVIYNIGNSGNCVMIDRGPNTGLGTSSFTLNNNTVVSPCTFPRFSASHPAEAWAGNGSFENNHFVGYTAPLSNVYNIDAGTTTTITDNSGHVFMPSATATAQGYTTANNFAPTLITNGTVGAGTNNTTWCNSLTNTIAQTQCKAGFAPIIYNAATHSVIIPSPGIARPAIGAWDAGAYQFSAPLVLATPTFSPVAGTYIGTQNVTVTLSGGSTGCYTTDGSTPTGDGAGTCTHGTTYSTPVAVASNLTLQAIATKSGSSDSLVGSAAYVINAAPPVGNGTNILVSYPALGKIQITIQNDPACGVQCTVTLTCAAPGCGPTFTATTP